MKIKPPGPPPAENPAPTPAAPAGAPPDLAGMAGGMAMETVKETLRTLGVSDAQINEATTFFNDPSKLLTDASALTAGVTQVSARVLGIGEAQVAGVVAFLQDPKNRLPSNPLSFSPEALKSGARAIGISEAQLTEATSFLSNPKGYLAANKGRVAMLGAQALGASAAQQGAKALGISDEHLGEASSFLKDPKGYLMKNVPKKLGGFLGTVISLYTALLLQNCQAEQGFKQEYLEQLGAFKEELTVNANRKASFEEVFGGLGVREIGGALQAYAKELEEGEEEAGKLSDCSEVYSELVSDHSDLIQNHALLAQLPEEEREGMAEVFKFVGECKELSKKLKDDEWKFRSLNVDLGMRQETWEAMRRSSNKSFPNRELGLDLGTIYGRIQTILKEMEEVERELNNSFAKSLSNLQQAKVALAFVLNDHLEDIDTDLDSKAPPKVRRPPPTPEQIQERVNHYTTLRTNVDTHADDAYNAWGTIDLKISRIKELATELDGLYASAQKFIDQEMAETNKGYYPMLSMASKPSPGKKAAAPAASQKKSAVKKAEPPKKPAAKGKPGAKPAEKAPGKAPGGKAPAPAPAASE